MSSAMNTLRKSFRRKKGAADAALSVPGSLNAAAAPGTLRFRLTVSDAGLEFSPLFQPTGVSAVLRRRGRRWRSAGTSWEASLKSPREGFCFWHPPFRAAVDVTKVAPEADGGEDSKKHKDVYLSLEDVDGKGRRKLLAKARLDLLEFRHDRGSGTTARRVKLYPETRKVVRAHANVVVRQLGPGEEEEEDGGEVAAGALAESVAATPDGLSLNAPSVASAEDRPEPVRVEVEAKRTSEEEEEEKAVTKTDPSEAPPTVAESTTPKIEPPPAPKVEVTKEEKSSTETAVKTVVKTEVKEIRVSEKKKTDEVRVNRDVSHVLRDAPAEESKSKGPVVLSLSSTAGGPLARVTGDRLRLSQRSQEANRDDVLGWAKDRLRGYPQIKITNLHSSWQNGVGFCALIHSRYPDLIPIDLLKPREVEANFNLALQACQVIGVNIPDILRDFKQGSAASSTGGLNVKTTARFLAELKRVFEDEGGDAELSAEDVDSFRKRAWMIVERKSFSGEESTSSLPPLPEKYEVERQEEEEANGQDQETEDLANEEVVEEQANACYEGSPTKPPTANRQRALDMIAKARRAESLNSAEGNGDGGEGVSAEVAPTAAVRRVGGGGKVLSHRESRGDLGQIGNELRLLELESERVDHEQEMLAAIIRDGAPDSADQVLPRYLQLVNEKNGLVRRQMQLNLFEKEAELAARQAEIQSQLQRLSEVEDERKTESARRQEAALLDELVKVVNEKNELVIHLDNQERGIHDDQTIQDTLMTSTAGVAGNGKKPEECVLQ